MTCNFPASAERVLTVMGEIRETIYIHGLFWGKITISPKTKTMYKGLCFNTWFMFG